MGTGLPNLVRRRDAVRDVWAGRRVMSDIRHRVHRPAHGNVRGSVTDETLGLLYTL